jgi:hypothetical protein
MDREREMLRNKFDADIDRGIVPSVSEAKLRLKNEMAYQIGHSVLEACDFTIKKSIITDESCGEIKVWHGEITLDFERVTDAS